MLCAPYCLSLSATFAYLPEYHTTLLPLLGPVVFQLNIDDLKGSILAPYQKFLIKIQLSPIERRQYDLLMSDFKTIFSEIQKNHFGQNTNELFQILNRSTKGKMALTHLRKARNLLSHCDEKLKRLSELLIRFADRKILIFTSNAETTLKISSELLIFPILAETPKNTRKKGLELFLEGKLSALVTCRDLNEGFDMPSADMAIIIGGSHGEREHIQRIGRILRSAPGKFALIYELVCIDTIEVRQWRKRNHCE